MPLPRTAANRKNAARYRRNNAVHAHDFPHANAFEPEWVKDEPQLLSVFATVRDILIPLHNVGSKDAAERYRTELQAEHPIFNNLDFYYQTRGTPIRVPIEIVPGESNIPIEVHPDNHKLREMWAEHREAEKKDAREVMDRALKASKNKGSMSVQIPQDDGALKTVRVKDGAVAKDETE